MSSTLCGIALMRQLKSNLSSPTKDYYSASSHSTYTVALCLSAPSSNALIH